MAEAYNDENRTRVQNLSFHHHTVAARFEARCDGVEVITSTV